MTPPIPQASRFVLKLSADDVTQRNDAAALTAVQLTRHALGLIEAVPSSAAPYRHLSTPLQLASIQYRNNGTFENLTRLADLWGSLLLPAPEPRVLPHHEAGSAVARASQAYRAQAGVETMSALRDAWIHYAATCTHEWACFQAGTNAGTCSGAHFRRLDSEMNGFCPHCAKFSPGTNA
ncbi:hypothetical protein [Deinococcus sp. QL22]|uniref:hypothetical protein n=1 Tax=Deinococcus sp. QL22 TaxID=2939437 RepID=UPI0020170469|nr:hypothetical protein [Deinococcus sp. QL22]UQN08843.1 hypothetical protein M1R55_19810 [Deinococcus sp. QL22]